jgi:hypothetical protein
MLLRNREIINEQIKENETYRDDNKYNSVINNTFIFCMKYTYKSIIVIINASGIYLVWVILHYLASHLYIQICVPNTIIGFLMSPFMTATPHCQALRWVVFNGANMINNMWVVLGTWICTNFLIINKNSNENT